MNDIDWTFEGTWPHPPQWFETPEGRMHYVDVGAREGRPIVLVHGNPSWGYLFRNFIAPLVGAGHRVIVPDHLGFGRSDKPERASAHRIEAHAQRFAALLDSLELRRVTIAPHDWGGPIALDWATQRPERVERLVLLDTFVHRPDPHPQLPLPLRLFRVPGLGELLVQGLHAIVRAFLLGGGIAHHDRLTPLVRRAYLAPHPSWSTRAGILALARQYPAAALQGRVNDRLAALASRPAFIAWAAKDNVLDARMLALWRRDFPRAEVLELPDAGHFLQEDAHERIVPALLRFMETPLAAFAQSQGRSIV